MTFIFDLLFHLIFSINLLCLMGIITLSIARKTFPQEINLQQRLLKLAMLICFIKILYVLFFYALFYPEWGMIDDALFYYKQIKFMVDAPVEAIKTFYGSHSQGLPVIYGFIFYLHQIYSEYAVLALNVFIGVMTCMTAFLLTRTMTDDKLIPFIAMALVAVYPECFFWNARLYKENLIIFLMPLICYFSIRYSDTRKLKHLFLLTLATFALFTVRIYLVLEVFLILIYFGFSLTRKRPVLMFLIICGVLGLSYFLYTQDQLIVRILTWKNPELRSLGTINWELVSGLFLKNFRYVFSVIAGGKFGSFGILFLPFALLIGTMLVATLVKFKKIFGGYSLNAGLNLFIILCFYFSLIFSDYASIRFRSCVSVLLICLVTVAGKYFWVMLSLPKFSMFPIKPHMQSPK